jgi:hypothetical protein
MLANPNYELYAKHGKHIEDSLYAATYQAYLSNDYSQVFDNYEMSSVDFPEGAHRSKFMFIQAMSELYTGQRDSFLVTLKQVIEKYPQDEITQMAQSIMKGIEEGRLLADDKYNASDIWGRRSVDAALDSTITQQELSDEKITPFVFLLAYPTNSLDENQLLFEMAKYNFSNFMVRNFDINIIESNGISQMQVHGFMSYDETHAYAQKLYGDSHMNLVLTNIRSVIISEKNLQLLGKVFSFDDYKKFYDEKFAPLQISEELLLDEPSSIEFEDPEEVTQDSEDSNIENDTNYYEDDTEGGIIF